MNSAYYSKPELMVFECRSLPVTPFDLAYIYAKLMFFASKMPRIRQICDFCIQKVTLERQLSGFLKSGDVYTHSMTLFTETRQDSTQNHFFANAISQKITYRKPYKHLINTMIFHAFLLRFRDFAQNVTHAKRLNHYQNIVQMQSARSQNPARCQGFKKTRQFSTQSHFFW